MENQSPKVKLDRQQVRNVSMPNLFSIFFSYIVENVFVLHVIP